jgi:hypothetical protein
LGNFIYISSVCIKRRQLRSTVYRWRLSGFHKISFYTLLSCETFSPHFPQFSVIYIEILYLLISKHLTFVNIRYSIILVHMLINSNVHHGVHSLVRKSTGLKVGQLFIIGYNFACKTNMTLKSQIVPYTSKVFGKFVIIFNSQILQYDFILESCLWSGFNITECHY